MKLLVTGGAGFIGSNFVIEWLEQSCGSVVNLDKLTYAGSLANLTAVNEDSRHVFVRGDICDAALVQSLLREHRPDAVVHLAAESHVDRSIHSACEFVRTNVEGTWALLEQARQYWSELPETQRRSFRFLHVSTDEVYGSLGPEDAPFTEESPYAPNSPYAASKAAADHMVRAYYRTHGLPTLTTNCSNNYGPRQFPEKLIPLTLLNALQRRPLPVYGDGGNVRDWLYVSDHCDALRVVLQHGHPGETYNIGGNCELRNIDLVRTLCAELDKRFGGELHEKLVRFVSDRPGHDRRYAIDSRKITRELGWKPKHHFRDAFARTVEWCLANQEWFESVRTDGYEQWIKKQYATIGRQ